jgi:hypothetical protein
MNDLPELADIEEIKARMPVTYVLHLSGHAPDHTKGRDLMYLTPWRQDSNPSLACYPERDGQTVDRWRDMARGEGGDILDLIGTLAPKYESFSERLEVARKMYARFTQETDWTAPEPERSTGSFDVEAARAELQQWSLDQDTELLETWLHEREDYLHNISAGWLHRTFKVHAYAGEIKAPYLDRSGELVVYKYRKPGEKFKSASGTRSMWTLFYGEWLDTDPSRPVVLCEGEPDVWSGTHASQDYVFFGLPSGAGTRPEKMQTRLAGRRILIAMDGDEAGRAASLLWATELSKNNTVEIVPVPEDKDLSSVADIPGLLRQARPYEPAMPGIMVIAGRYHRTSKNGEPGMQLGDFNLTPLRVMTSQEGALSYEVTDGRREHLILSEDLASKNTMRRWAASRGMTWAGSDTDVALVSSRLKADSIFCPSEGSSDIAGLHNGHIVWADGSIGDSKVRYIPFGNKVKLDIQVSEGVGDHRLIYAMREMNDHAITDPILAWAAVAPFRSLLDKFPVLNVAGTSGSGKTTTVQAIIPVLTGSHIFKTLSSSTPWAVEAFIGSTNAFPVVFDEYRPGARSEAMVRLEQLARDAYNGYESSKSSGGDSWNVAQNTRTDAPLCIAGEQSITETSHAERMILVNILRPKQRDPKHQRALDFIASADGTLAHDYLTFVVRTVAEKPSLLVRPAGAPTLPDRVRFNLGVLELGWRLLNDFLALKGAAPLDAPDWSGIIATTEEVTATNPTLEALSWAIGDRFASQNVWVDDDELVVQAAGFVSDVRKSGVFVLPGNNAKTISDQLKADYGAFYTRRTPPLGDKPKKVWVMPVDRVFPDGVD